MKGMLGIELWRSPMRLWFPGLVALDLAVLFGRSHWWIGVWPQASAAAQIPAFYLGPAVAVGAAWSAGRVSRRGASLQVETAARPRWQIEAAQLTGTLGWALTAYLVGFVAADLVTVPDGGPGQLWLGYLVLGATVVVGCAALGHLVGRWSSSQVFAPMVCGLVCFIFLASFSGGLDLFLLVGDPATTLSAKALAGRVLLALALVLVAVLVPRPGPDWFAPWSTPKVVRATAAVAILVVALSSFWSSGALVEARAAPAAPLCTDTRPTMCLWPEERKYEPVFAAMATRIDALPASIFRSPASFSEQGLLPPTGHYEDGAPLYNGSFYILEGSTWDAGVTIADGILRESIGPACAAAEPTEQNRLTQSYGELSVWLTARITGAGQPSQIHGGPPGVDVRAVGELIRRPESEQVAWVRDHIRAIHAVRCG